MIIEHSAESGDDPAVETIVIFAANVAAQQRLDLDREVRQIENGLRRSRKRFRLHPVWPHRGEDLRQALLDHQPSYVHFCGHGTGTGGIALDGQLVPAGALANLFALFSSRIKCVVLNACYSEVQANAIVRHVDHVVGMNKEIGDDAAIEFSSAFYDALGAGEDIQTAVEFGRNAIELARLPEHLTPELLIRNPHGPPRRVFRRYRDWDGAPAVSLLYGREAVAELLRSWILEDFCRVVLITGMGGIGKSDLASCIGRGANRSPSTSWTLATGIEGHFDAVLWRSLLNAPPPEELFADLIGVLVEHDGPMPSSPGERLNEVLRCLEQRRCLVILDNIEAVLRPGDADMRYRKGFELYGSFLELAAKKTHQSCLLLTSREKPYPITTLEGDGKPVRSLELPGLEAGAIRDVFNQISTFSGDDRSWEEIGKTYGGNPLAMELVARHVHEVYGGDVDSFVEVGQPLFHDIETLLDWHFDRLSERQMELVEWLAIDRVPVTLAHLRNDLVRRDSRESVASTLQGLRRRLPIEQRADHQFSLQPVLIEHATARIVRRLAAVLHVAVEAAVHSLADGGSARALFDAMRMLNSHALMKATSRDNVREMQERLVLGPIAEELGSRWRASDLRVAFDSMLHVWRSETASKSGYAAANVIHLLAKLAIPLDRLDVSKLPVWQACLDEVNLHEADFSFSEFRQTNFRHAFGTVFSVCYSPDGTLIAAGDDSGQVQIFSASTGDFRQSLAGHADTVAALAFSPDGSVLVTGSSDDTICIWDVAGGHQTQTLLGHEGWVYAVAITPDGRTVASASEDGTCRLWDLQTGKSRRLSTPGATFLGTVAFSPDGKLLATGGGGGDLFLFRMDDLDQPLRLPHHRRGIRSVAFSRQGDLLATAAEAGEVALWRPDGSFLAALSGHTDDVMSVSFSPDGHLLASASVDHTIRLWSTVRHEGVAQLQAGDSRVWAVNCSPAGRTLVSACEDGTIRVWDIGSRERLMTLQGYSNKSWALASSTAGRRLVVGNEDGVVRIWDTSEGRVTRELRGHQTRIWAVATSTDERWVASASDDSTVRLWDVASGRCRHVWRGHHGWVRAVTFDETTRYVASVAEDGKAIVWDVETGARALHIDSKIVRLFTVAFCRRSELIAVAGSESMIRIFSAADGSHIGDLRGHGGWISALIAVGDGGLLSCSSDGTAKLWDLCTWTCSMTFEVGRKISTADTWISGRSVLTGSEDGVIIRWNIDTGRRETEVRAHQGPVWALAVDEEAQTVATAGDDGIVRIWSLPDLLPSTTPNALRSPRPYEAMNISGCIGLQPEQKDALSVLGAIEMPSR